MQKIPGRVWYVRSQGDTTVLIAMDLEHDEQYVQWFDTIKDRIMKIGKIVDASPEHFVFDRSDTEGGQRYTFVPMTIALYEQFVKHRLLIPKEITSLEEMLTGLEDSRKNAW